MQLNITSRYYLATPTDKNINCIFFLNMLLTKIPAALMKYFPDTVIKAIDNIESVQIQAQKNNEQIDVHCSFNKKKNDLPIVKW